ncbi:GRB10-interacting GYF protein 1-like isoform X2 [Grus americana]|uniref:GRB10-interacting GYF protein 1-like isoform X2 n=1 Tax=Grus americana TaxID=9117 RepID=UPI002407EE95|nr:GRB10-interacting GYF protein 1-like isoform X2 [Grus americana]
MGEWFQAGYFPMALLVKRGCDEGFQPLGDVIKMWGRVPFAPGPSPPPLLTPPPGPPQTPPAQERLKQQQDLAALYQQLQHQQFLQLLGRQPLGPCPPPQKTGELTPQQLGALLQQLQVLKPRQGEPNLLRSLSLPEATPLWDPSQAPGSDSALWELPLGSPPPSPILEQLQLQHKLQELRARREEDDQRKRRQEEELRRKQCRQQETLLKLLQQSGVPRGGPQNWTLPKTPPGPDGEWPPPKAQRGPRAVGALWGPELWPPPEKSPPAWEESGAGGGLLRGGGGGKGGRGGPPPGPSGRGPEEAALLKLLRGLPRPPPDALAHWCQAALQALGGGTGTGGGASPSPRGGLAPPPHGPARGSALPPPADGATGPPPGPPPRPPGSVVGGRAAACAPLRPWGKAPPHGGARGGEGEIAPPPAAAAQRPQHPGLLAAWPRG